jgi:hypothetical protein
MDGVYVDCFNNGSPFSFWAAANEYDCCIAAFSMGVDFRHPKVWVFHKPCHEIVEPKKEE